MSDGNSNARLIVVSAGAFGREIYHSALHAAAAGTSELSCAGFLDDRPNPLAGTQLADVPILGTPQSYAIKPQDRFLVAIGAPAERLRYAALLDARGARYATLTLPGARIVTPTERVGAGCVFDSGAQVSCDVTIGRLGYVGVHATIGHDCMIGEACQIGAHAFIGGGVTLGDGVVVRSSASIAPGVQVEAGASVGPNSVVLRRVKAGANVFGVPALVVKS